MFKEMRWYFLGQRDPRIDSSPPQNPPTTVVSVSGIDEERADEFQDLQGDLRLLGVEIDDESFSSSLVWHLNTVPEQSSIPDIVRRRLEARARRGPADIRFLARAALGELSNADRISALGFEVAERMGLINNLPDQGPLLCEDAIRLFREGVLHQGTRSDSVLGLGLCRDQHAEELIIKLFHTVEDPSDLRLSTLMALALLDFERWLPELKKHVFRASIPSIRSELSSYQDDVVIWLCVLDETVFPYHSSDLENILKQMPTEEFVPHLNSPQPDCRIEAAIEMVRRPAPALRADHLIDDIQYYDFKEVIRLLHAALKADQLSGARALIKQCLGAEEREVHLMATLCAFLLSATVIDGERR